MGMMDMMLTTMTSSRKMPQSMMATTGVMHLLDVVRVKGAMGLKGVIEKALTSKMMPGVVDTAGDKGILDCACAKSKI